MRVCVCVRARARTGGGGSVLQLLCIAPCCATGCFHPASLAYSALLCKHRVHAITQSQNVCVMCFSGTRHFLRPRWSTTPTVGCRRGRMHACACACVCVCVCDCACPCHMCVRAWQPQHACLPEQESQHALLLRVPACACGHMCMAPSPPSPYFLDRHLISSCVRSVQHLTR